MGKRQIQQSRDEIDHVLDQYIHNIDDRRVMTVYLTDYPNSMERMAEVCSLSVSTVKRIVRRNMFIYDYLPEKAENELQVN